MPHAKEEHFSRFTVQKKGVSQEAQMRAIRHFFQAKESQMEENVTNKFISAMKLEAVRL